MKIKLYFRVKTLIEFKKSGSAVNVVGQKYLIHYNPEEYLEAYVDAANCKIDQSGSVWVPLNLFNFNF